MYDAPTYFHLFGFDSGLSGSDDVDEVAIDGGAMDVQYVSRESGHHGFS
jgi:hypothetical protein